ncbi:MAG: DUF6689 family protein [Dokdonella sp.]|uniref:DUF6689 family protein n=1 Tax=Dokdonella sp. TaxID=2291710 RepID=UPI003264A37E
MIIQSRYSAVLAVLGALGCLCANPARAAVIVSVTGNVAHAQISLANGANTYDAEVTITFDTPLNLDAQSLNLTAELVNPNDPILTARFANVAGVVVDPAFPMMITVEPPNLGWLFKTNFDGNEDGTGMLSFLNDYQVEIHTANLTFVQNSRYRILKAPVGGLFGDITEDVLSGSVRTRGRGGAFSQFVVVEDNRLVLTVVLGKIVDLDVRILAAALNNVLQGDLLGLLSQVQLLVLLDVGAAISALDELILEIQIGATNGDIANVWQADHSVTNDAGEMLSLAKTLRFSLVRLQGGASNP